MPKTMCAIFASSFPVPGAVSSIICIIFLIYSGATILFCCKKSKAQKKRKNKANKDSRMSRASKKSHNSFEEKRRKSGKYGGGDDYQSLAGLDGDMFVKGGANKRIDSPARGRRGKAAERRAKKIKQRRGGECQDDIEEDVDVMPFTQSDIKLPGKSLLSKDTIRSRQSIVASTKQSKVQDKGASLFI
ncbi:unnamed protein product [Meloidogyne enterolobii]|uniref:Uncharacterized protein n=1 Tax=Meloidogyne enterolobii TaxID=390850 RepID=A0ACB0XKR9_MELEN